MNKLKITLVFVLISVFVCHSQSTLWSLTTLEKISKMEKFERANQPEKFKLFSLDFNQFKSQLVNAPLDLSAQTSNVVVSFPDHNGDLSEYFIYEAPIMEKGLSDRYPDIKSYIGKGIKDKSATVRFSTTVFGLHVMMISGEIGTYYIDTYTKDLNNYIVYGRHDIKNKNSFNCMFQDPPIINLESELDTHIERATDSKFRQYRLALACTIEYAAYHVNASPQNEVTEAEKKATVLAAMNVTMTRVNGIYEKDMSLRMNLVANNDAIIFIASDSFSNSSSGSLINESQTVIDANIGSANYDIGHTVSTGGGGLAQLNVPCTASKARGITGSSSPVGDPYDVDYVAHEMGHQFGGPHTFSGNTGSCSGNGSAADAVEPGSGTTIMAYAGICSPNDVQSNSDPYFHTVSIAKMNAFMIGTGNCAAQAANGNTPPVIPTLTSYTIPKNTAFVLTGSATDANAGAALTYCWEQINAASGTNMPTATQTSGPIYRSLNPSTSPKRYFPKFSDVLNANLVPTWEVTPNIARTLNFALTVRDNQTPTGGQTGRANMTVTVANVGPFNTTAPIASTSWSASSNQTITWNVGGTTANGINTANVDILISTDNGVTFTTLLANTANDGTETVLLPNTPSTNCRILIQALGNVFYAVTPKFTITPSLGSENFELNDFGAYPNPNNGNFTIRFNSSLTNDVNIKLYDMRGRVVFEKKYFNQGDFKENIELRNVQSGIYILNVLADGNKKAIKRIIVE